MFKQIILPILGTALFISLVGYLYKNPDFFTSIVHPKTVTINEKIVTVSIADTSEKRVKGLSGTTSLDENSGMLFVFDTKEATPSFWMKDMEIPIDIIWISDGKIVQIDKKVSAPTKNTPDSKLTIYPAKQPVDYILEVNSGFSDSNSIKVGDSVDLSKI